MSLFKKNQEIRANLLDKTSVTPLEKEQLNSVHIERKIDFFNGQCKINVANRLLSRQKAYKLLYDLYFKMGITPYNGNGLWLSIYDALPETTTFVAEDDRGCVEGALTVVFDSPIGLPADELYKNEIDELRNTGEKICEFVSLGIKNEGKSSIKFLASLFYCAFLHAWQKENLSNLTITVHSRYENFYRQKLFFEKIGPERNFAKVNGAPTVLLSLSLMGISRLRHKHRVFPFYLLNYSEKEELELAKKIENMIYPMSEREFYTFFIEKTNIWEKASPHQKNIIKNTYPPNKANHNNVSRALAKGISKNYRDYENTCNSSGKIVKR
jgi:hypothetical protein